MIASVVGGHAFYVFNAAHLNLIFASPYIAEEIVQVQAAEDGLIYTALLETKTI